MQSLHPRLNPVHPVQIHNFYFAPDYGTKAEKSAFHGERFFYDTKPLKTLGEMRAEGRLVKYVFLTGIRKNRQIGSCR
jgi:hypothetical protein